jgi:hypothetical protein
MNKRFLLIPAILAATAALSAPHNARSEPIDAQSQAAALLSGLHTHGAFEGRDQGDEPSSSVSADAQASAAALLTGRSASGQAKTVARSYEPSAQRTQRDAHARAAELLSGSRTRAEEPLRVTATSPNGDHPAVLVAKQWHARGIDPNQFIVAHPAGLALN